ncbi:MAG: hypothetical protein JWM21_449 [Acidobacteria bacterium]|nr:hypothetical protein [Acidobacteriota bacterium]
MATVGKVFISHASADKSFVDRLVADLSTRSIPVWYDKLDLRIGESVPGKINEGLAGAKYFLIVLSKSAVNSSWVREELNAALMKQVSQGGTFVLPVLLEDCEIPPLLAHRRYADFRSEYSPALNELLALWGSDTAACDAAKKDNVQPWPDVDMSDAEFVYLHSTRFDKFFRMSCSLSWSANKTINYLVDTLSLPWNIELSNVGMKWSFSYGLVFDGKSISLSESLRDAGVEVGGVVMIRISGTYEDLYEKELKELWDGSKMYLMTPEMLMREERLKAAIAARGRLTNNRLKEIADVCFSNV